MWKLSLVLWIYELAKLFPNLSAVLVGKASDVALVNLGSYLAAFLFQVSMIRTFITKTQYLARSNERLLSFPHAIIPYWVRP